MKRWMALLAVLACAAYVGGVSSPRAQEREGDGAEFVAPRAGVDTESPADPRPSRDDLRVRDVVSKGLKHLAAIQNNDGSWSNDIGNKLGSNYQVNRDGIGKPHIGVTAICCMAFMAAGHTPDRGEHKRTVAAGLQFVFSHMDNETGWISAFGTRMYSHAFATMFLAEVYGMTKDPVVLSKLRQSVQFIVRSQNDKGSWRYVPNEQSSDMSICVCQLQALRAAANVGVVVPENAIEAAREYVRQSYIVSRGEPGAFQYQIDFDGRSSFALTAAGVVALQSMGQYDSHTYEVPNATGTGTVVRRIDLSRSIAYLLNNRPDDSPRYVKPGWGECRYGFWYGHYYAAQAMYQYQYASPRTWQEWNAMNREHFIKMQHPNGAWTDEIGGWDPARNAYATGMACLVLSIPRGFLPIFQN